MKNCLDTGSIQAFLDGELTPAEASVVSAHIAMCDACAAQLATAEEESAMVFSVLEREMDALVPTHRLWSKINDSIEVERHGAPFWRKALRFISVSVASPSLAAAALVIMAFAIFSAILVNRNVEPIGPPPAGNLAVGSPAVNNVIQGTSPVPGSRASSLPTADRPEPRPPAVAVVGFTPSKRVYNDMTRPSPASAERTVYIPGEESYVKTIATLDRTVNGQKEVVLRPSERVSFERDLAVVDDAIRKMRKEVRKNPKNESAKQVLYSSYQNKIDLLNSVSQREELVASLKD